MKREIISMLISVTMLMVVGASGVLAEWPETIEAELKDAIPLKNGQAYPTIAGDVVYKAEFHSKSKKVKLLDFEYNGPTGWVKVPGESEWIKSVAILAGWYHNKAGKCLMTHRIVCGFLSNGEVVIANPMKEIESRVESCDKKWKITGHQRVHSSSTQRVVIEDISSWRDTGLICTSYELVDDTHVSIVCDKDGKVEFYMLKSRSPVKRSLE